GVGPGRQRGPPPFLPPHWPRRSSPPARWCGLSDRRTAQHTFSAISFPRLMFPQIASQFGQSLDIRVLVNPLDGVNPALQRSQLAPATSANQLISTRFPAVIRLAVMFEPSNLQWRSVARIKPPQFVFDFKRADLRTHLLRAGKNTESLIAARKRKIVVRQVCFAFRLAPAQAQVQLFEDF